MTFRADRVRALHHPLCSALNIPSDLAFPDPNHGPTGGRDPRRVSLVPFLVGLELLLPESGVRPSEPGGVVGAAVPEATVDEDSNVIPGKHEIGRASWRHPPLKTEPQTQPVHRLPEGDLRLGVPHSSTTKMLPFRSGDPPPIRCPVVSGHDHNPSLLESPEGKSATLSPCPGSCSNSMAMTRSFNLPWPVGGHQHHPEYCLTFPVVGTETRRSSREGQGRHPRSGREGMPDCRCRGSKTAGLSNVTVRARRVVQDNLDTTSRQPPSCPTRPHGFPSGGVVTAPMPQEGHRTETCRRRGQPPARRRNSVAAARLRRDCHAHTVS